LLAVAAGGHDEKKLKSKSEKVKIVEALRGDLFLNRFVVLLISRKDYELFNKI